MKMEFGLSPAILADIKNAIKHFPEVERAVIFGSRAKNTYKDYSDIDLAIYAPSMNDSTFAQLWSALDDLPLVFKMDVLHVETLDNNTLKEKITQDGKTIYTREEKGTCKKN